jgi:hypothetical protein
MSRRLHIWDPDCLFAYLLKTQNRAHFWQSQGKQITSVYCMVWMRFCAHSMPAISLYHLPSRQAAMIPVLGRFDLAPLAQPHLKVSFLCLHTGTFLGTFLEEFVQ